ncbi:MAG: hypothetical protein IKQ71_02815 [Lachnospiraceae bacterium]|nr:hypothetical protein [Lachnospiraceae bacterium]
MEELLKLLKDGHARTLEMLADQLGTDTKDVLRQIEYLEHAGLLRSVLCDQVSCNGCTGCSTTSGTKACKSCLPEGGFKNMGQMWEVVS